MNRRDLIKGAVASGVGMLAVTTLKAQGGATHDGPEGTLRAHPQQPVFVGENAFKPKPDTRTPEEVFADWRQGQELWMRNFIEADTTYFKNLYSLEMDQYFRLKNMLITRGITPDLRIFEGVEAIILNGNVITTLK